jgi:hypothetical protein
MIFTPPERQDLLRLLQSRYLPRIGLLISRRLYVIWRRPGDLLTRSTLRSLPQGTRSRSYEEKKTTLRHRRPSGLELGPSGLRAVKAPFLPPGCGPSGLESRTVRAPAASTAWRPGDPSQTATIVHLTESNPRYCSSREGPRVCCCLVSNRW